MSEQDTQVNGSATNDTQEQELDINLEETTDEETVESLKEKLAKEQDARRQLTARAKAAEEKLKTAPVAKKEETPLNSKLDDEAIDKKILKSQGMSDELIGELSALAKVRGKSLLDTQTDPLFVALKESKEAEAKKAKANLGASRGSGTVKRGKDFSTPNLTDEEHKEMWRASQGR